MIPGREEMIDWLKANCPTVREYDFWYQFYDDLDDCFDDLEPWKLARLNDWDWPSWDMKFTGKRIPWTVGDEIDLIPEQRQRRSLEIDWDWSGCL